MPVTFYRTLVDLVKSWKTLTTRELVKFAGEIEARLGRLEGQSADVDATLAALRQVALDRINLVLTPAIEKVFQIQERGFLIAHSASPGTLGEGNILTFDIEDEAERELFTPSPFLALTREDNAEDVGIARLVSYSQQHGELIVEVMAFYGAAGPHNDWVIAATAGPTVASIINLAQANAARDLAQDWAEKPQGEDVAGVGTRSAKHYALFCATQLSAMQALYDDIGAAAILVAGGAPVTAVAGEVGDISASALKAALGIATSDISGFASHTHAISDVTNLQNSLDAKAPLASPALTGNPTAPTQSSGNNTTRIATTAFVQAAITALINSSPSALDTLKELADALGNDANFATTVTNALATKALKDVQEFTGSGTWTKPAGATFVMVEVLGGGGGGGSGRRGASLSVRSGGGGGGGGERPPPFFFKAADLGASESIVIGAGGSGATGATANDTNGNNGGNGGDTTFGGSKAVARGGLGGAGGGTADVAGGAGGNIAMVAQSAGTAGSNGGHHGGGGGGGTLTTGTPDGFGGGGSASGGLGGGGGGSVTTSNIGGDGGSGGTRSGDGTAGGNGGANPAAGAAGSATQGANGGNAVNGGGNGSAGGNGGAGTYRGNGGGGGGGGNPNITGSTGGAGAAGWCRVTAW